MSKVVSNGYTDTAISGVSSLNFGRALINFGKDFAKKEQSKGELVLANLSSPLDRVETVRLGSMPIANVYSNTGIDAKVQSPTKKGVRILAQVSDTISVTDTTDPSYRVDLPISAHIVVNTAASEHITAEMIISQVARAVSCLYETGSTDTTRIKALLRGSLEPSDL